MFDTLASFAPQPYTDEALARLTGRRAVYRTPAGFAQLLPPDGRFPGVVHLVIAAGLERGVLERHPDDPERYRIDAVRPPVRIPVRVPSVCAGPDEVTGWTPWHHWTGGDWWIMEQARPGRPAQHRNSPARASHAATVWALRNGLVCAPVLLPAGTPANPDGTRWLLRLTPRP